MSKSVQTVEQTGKLWKPGQGCGVLIFVLVGLVAFRVEATDPEQDAKRPAIGAKVISTKEKELVALFRKNKMPQPPRRGMLVTTVIADSPADRAGLRELDVITKINDTTVSDPIGYVATIDSLTIGQPSKFYVLRLPTTEITRWEPKSFTVTPIAKIEMDRLKKATCPLGITAVVLHHDVIGTPVVSVSIKNPEALDAVAIEIAVECWNRFGEKVLNWTHETNVFRGIGQKSIKPGEEKVLSWRLAEYDTTTKVRVWLTRIKLADGTDWKIEGNKHPPTRSAELPR